MLAGQIAVVSTLFDQISEPELILRPVSGTGEVQLSLSVCNENTFITEEFDFPIGAVNFQLIGNDTNGVLFEHSIEETVVFSSDSTC
jgi:hypothetical protein